MSTGFNEETCKRLKKQLPRYTRRGHGGNFSYIKGSDVIKSLNDAFNHSWSSEKVEVSLVEDQVLMLVSISVFVDGDVVTHHGYGSSPIMRHKQTNTIIDIGNTYKSAYTNALKKAAEQFGIGLLSEDEEEEPSLAEDNNVEPRSFVKVNPNSSVSVTPEQQSKVFSKTPSSILGKKETDTSASSGFKPLVQNGSKASTPAEVTKNKETSSNFPKLNVENKLMLSSQQKMAIERLTELRGFTEEFVLEKAAPTSGAVKFADLSQEEATKVITFLSGYQG